MVPLASPQNFSSVAVLSSELWALENHDIRDIQKSYFSELRTATELKFCGDAKGNIEVIWCQNEQSWATFIF